MTKDDNKDVKISCLGNVRGCKVLHCDVGGVCYSLTLLKEKAKGD